MPSSRWGDRARRWMYAGGRPNALARLLGRATTALARSFGPDRLVTLEVPGRRSGRTISLPLVVADEGGERYLVAMLGEGTAWVANVRAARGEAVLRLRHGHAETVTLEEVAPSRRAPILRRYLAAAPGARAHIPVAPGAPLGDLAAVAERYPVFRITPRSPRRVS